MYQQTKTIFSHQLNYTKAETFRYLQDQPMNAYNHQNVQETLCQEVRGGGIRVSVISTFS